MVFLPERVREERFEGATSSCHRCFLCNLFTLPTLKYGCTWGVARVDQGGKQPLKWFIDRPHTSIELPLKPSPLTRWHWVEWVILENWGCKSFLVFPPLLTRLHSNVAPMQTPSPIVFKLQSARQSSGVNLFHFTFDQNTIVWLRNHFCSQVSELVLHVSEVLGRENHFDLPARCFRCIGGDWEVGTLNMSLGGNLRENLKQPTNLLACFQLLFILCPPDLPTTSFAQTARNDLSVTLPLSTLHLSAVAVHKGENVKAFPLCVLPAESQQEICPLKILDFELS